MKKILLCIATMMMAMTINAQTMYIYKGDVLVKTYTADEADRVEFKPAETAKTGQAKAKINGEEVMVNWIQLWEGGPKFAEFNVGLSNMYDQVYQGYYGWGGVTDMDKTDYYEGNDFDGNGNLKPENDTATRIWGENWRTPTKEELDGLTEYCTVADKWDGSSPNKKRAFKITGKGDYAENTIWLPYNGICQGGTPFNTSYYAYYWSSSQIDGNPVRINGKEKPSTTTSRNGLLMSVRAVLK